MPDFDSISGGPNWRPLSDTDLFERAHDLPSSYGRMALEQVKESAITSYGLGTALREAQTPPPAPSEDDIPEPFPSPVPPLAGRAESPEDRVRRLRETVAQRRKELGAITKEEWEASPSYRKAIPYDTGMTRDRAAALAAWNDEAEYRRSLIERGPKGIFSGALQFGSMFAGSALDPINYVPMASQAMRAAALSRFGTVGGSALVASADAAANTALFGLLTRQNRASFGDDVSFQAMLSDIAMGALVGAAFGGGVGAYQRWQANRSLHDLQRVQEARMALDEAIGDLVHGRPISVPQEAARLVTDLRDVQFPHLAGTGVGRFGDMPGLGEVQMPVMPRSDDPALAGLQDTLLTLRGLPGNVADKDGIAVQHASPHDFERFKLNNETIGTGEGHQAYGHGLYFSTSADVHQNYLDALGKEVVTVGGEPYSPAKPLHVASEYLFSFDGDRTKAIASLNTAAADLEPRLRRFRQEAKDMEGFPEHRDAVAAEAAVKKEIDALRNAVKLLQSKTFQPPEYRIDTRANSYEVRIKAKPDEFLDWDKPLSEQPAAIQNAVRKVGIEPPASLGRPSSWLSDATGIKEFVPNGAWVYESIGDAISATNALREAGIKGIRYLDGGSRNAGEGTSNYVVFDDSILQIVSKNGQPVKIDMPVREFLAMQGQATAKSVHPMTAKTQQPVIVAEPRPEAPDPKEQKAAASIGKRPASPEEEFGLAGDEAASPEILEFNQLKDRGRLQQSEIDAFARAAEIEQTANAYADGLTAAALCRVA